MGASDDTLIEQIYQAMHGTMSWQDWLSHLHATFDGVKFAMWGHDIQANSNLGLISSGFETEFMNQWVDYYSGVNAWAPGIARAPIGVPRTAEQLLDREQLVRTEYYHDWVKPQENVATGVGLTIFSDTNRFFGLTANVRLVDEERFNLRLKATLARLAPHLSRAMDHARRLPQGASLHDLERFVAQLPIAAIALNGQGRYCYMNALASKFIEQWGEPQLSSNGTFKFSDSDATKLLERAILSIQMRTMHALPHRTPVRLPRYGASCQMSVVPSPMVEVAEGAHFVLSDHGRPAAFLFLEAGPARARSAVSRQLATRFGLSPAETELSMALYAGETLGGIASRKGLSIHTVRNQLRTVFSKTQTHRQHQLVRLVSDLLGESPL